MIRYATSLFFGPPLMIVIGLNEGPFRYEEAKKLMSLRFKPLQVDSPIKMAVKRYPHDTNWQKTLQVQVEEELQRAAAVIRQPS